MSTVHDYAINTTKYAAERLLASAKRIPADKLEWKPLDNGRSALSILQECAYCPLWSVGTLNKAIEKPDPTEGFDFEGESAALTTLEAVEAALQKSLATYAESVKDFPIERLGESVTLPWGTFDYGSVIAFGFWNMMYHEGQLNYIQTLYGDFEM